MEDKKKLETRLKNLLVQRDQCITQHGQLSVTRDQVGARINAIDGAIETLRSILGVNAPVVEQKPPTRQQIRASARKKTTRKP